MQERKIQITENFYVSMIRKNMINKGLELMLKNTGGNFVKD